MTQSADESYRATLRARQAEGQRAAQRRRDEAMAVAQRAAAILREHFGMGDVVLFGSVARGEMLSSRSDIDLAVTSIEPMRYFEAVAAMQDISPDFAIDLVQLDRCSTGLRDVVLREGIRL